MSHSVSVDPSQILYGQHAREGESLLHTELSLEQLGIIFRVVYLLGDATPGGSDLKQQCASRYGFDFSQRYYEKAVGWSNLPSEFRRRYRHGETVLVDFELTWSGWKSLLELLRLGYSEKPAECGGRVNIQPLIELVSGNLSTQSK